MSDHKEPVNPNLVQVEFILVDIPAKTGIESDIQTLALELAGRLPKLVVRFFDERGLVTKLVQDYEATQSAYGVTIIELGKMSFGGRFAVSEQRDVARLSRKMDALRGQARSLTVGMLSSVTKGSRRIAIEDSPDRPLRMAVEAEFDHLVTTAKKAKDVFIFVFKPNDLLSEKNEAVVSMVFKLQL